MSSILLSHFFLRCKRHDCDETMIDDDDGFDGVMGSNELWKKYWKYKFFEGGKEKEKILSIQISLNICVVIVRYYM